jgi:hypothetical protein
VAPGTETASFEAVVKGSLRKACPAARCDLPVAVATDVGAAVIKEGSFDFGCVFAFLCEASDSVLKVMLLARLTGLDALLFGTLVGKREVLAMGPNTGDFAWTCADPLLRGTRGGLAPAVIFGCVDC